MKMIEAMIGAGRLAKGLWWGRPWSLVGGCAHASRGCEHCWAEALTHRFRKAPIYAGLTDEDGHWIGQVRCNERMLELPLHVRRPTVWAVWNDLLHEGACARTLGGSTALSPFQMSAFQTIATSPQHTFLILTKRPAAMKEALQWAEWAEVWNRMAPDYWGGSEWPVPNVGLGVSVEDQETADERIPLLLETPAAFRFVNVGPQLGPVNLDLGRPAGRGLDWVICECESGPGRRPFDLAWAESLRDQCAAAGVPFFLKQIPVNGRVSHKMSEWPEGLRVRELPGREGA